jgi:hypothetical protein
MAPLSLHLLLCLVGVTAAHLSAAWRVRRMARNLGHMN